MLVPERLTCRTQIEELSLAVGVIEAVVVGDNIQLAVAGDRESLDLFLDEAVGRLQIRKQIARQRLRQHLRRLASRDDPWSVWNRHAVDGLHAGVCPLARLPAPTRPMGRSYNKGMSGLCPDTPCYARHMNDRATKPRRHRLEVRVTPEQDALIRQASDLEDTTVTAFVLDTVTSRARRVVKQHQDMVLSNQAFDRFITEIDKPAKPVPELVDLFKHNPKLRQE